MIKEILLYLKHFFFLGIIFLIFSSSKLNALVVEGKGEYFFGPEISQNKACSMAEEKAKSNAISSVFGEKFSSEENFYCFQNSLELASKNCESNRVAWSYIDGKIKTLHKISKLVKKFENKDSCVVTIVADVISSRKQTDPNFDFEIKLNESNFRVRENLSIRINPTKPMYIYIFSWLPNTKERKIFKLYPNEYDLENLISETIKIPSKESELFYSFELDWNDSYPLEKNIIDEWIIVVASKKPLKFFSEYRNDEFKNKINEMNQFELRIKKKPYFLIK
mgnify:CR=1 FL=1